jgi:hypothetical protein
MTMRGPLEVRGGGGKTCWSESELCWVVGSVVNLNKHAFFQSGPTWSGGVGHAGI